MDKPEWTSAHLELLEQAEREPLGTCGQVTEVMLDLQRWRLIKWDAGARVQPRRTQKEYAALERVRPSGLYITPAGLALLAAVESLDGTAPPSKLPKPGAQKVAEGET